MPEDGEEGEKQRGMNPTMFLASSFIQDGKSTRKLNEIFISLFSYLFPEISFDHYSGIFMAA